MRFAAKLALVLLLVPLTVWGDDREDVGKVITAFHVALEARDIKAIEGLVAPDLVVIENGHRNDGWADFRENHLIPEFKGPAGKAEWELVKLSATATMAWGYTRQTTTVQRNAKSVDLLLWSVYVLEKREGKWTVVLLDWSLRRI